MVCGNVLTAGWDTKVDTLITPQNQPASKEKTGVTLQWTISEVCCTGEASMTKQSQRNRIVS